ncbi:DUF819 family protein [Tahibacter harae]|uniref:DUF819 family protein n=1 Tax=Tahibacter harae TaxID=2963937 RepID=A0ABT1QMU6_9GAMM|nr:DUF819 family protein [Tahibacter harae]MCQ4163747.1 DUF819 family protein [Tahibacter harae]
MIQSVWPYLGLMLLAAGLFPVLEQRLRWRLFEVLPPIVLTYLLVLLLAVAGLWQSGAEIQAAQRAVVAQLLPALLFLLMLGCDLRAILALGPRLLGVFACAMASILLAIVLCYLLFRAWLPAEGWKMLAALSATWTGGSANLLAVKQVIGLDDSALSPVLLADALCYSLWVVVLFSSAPLAARFNRWSRAAARPAPPLREAPARTAAGGGDILLWLGLGLLVAQLSQAAAVQLPAAGFLTTTSWSLLIATAAGLAAAHTPLAQLPGAPTLASALLAVLVAVLGSQSSFAGIAAAPLFVLCGLCVLAVHILLLALAARLFRFELHLCGIASLAQIGGVASAPLLAATYSTALVPVAVLMAMLGLVLGTGVGLFMASVLAALAPAAS